MFLEKIDGEDDKSDAFQILENIFETDDLPDEQKTTAIITLANHWFDTDFAIVSSIKGGVYTILYSASDIVRADPGLEFELCNTYCAKTLEQRGPVAYHSAGASDISKHACYNVFQLETYIGAPIFKGERVVGTVNFTREQKHVKFTSAQIRLVERIADCISQLVEYD